MSLIENEVRQRIGISETDHIAAKNRIVCAGNRDGDLVSRMLSKTEMDVCRNFGMNPTVYLREKVSGVERRPGVARR